MQHHQSFAQRRRAAQQQAIKATQLKIQITKQERCRKLLIYSAIAVAALGATVIGLFSFAIHVFIQQQKPLHMAKIKAAGGVNHELVKRPMNRMIDRHNLLFARTSRNGYHDRDARNLSEFDALLVKAILLAEDEHFYSNDSLQWVAARSLFRIIVSRGAGGGSTIYQQVAKTLEHLEEAQHLPGKIRRKLDELPAAQALIDTYREKYPSQYKQKILLVYLNQVYLGINVYGFQDAARVYFGKETTELSLAEKATLASLPSQPNAYFCQEDPQRQAKKRDYLLKVRNRLIDKMADRRLVTQQRADAAKQEPLGFKLDRSRCDDRLSSTYFKQGADRQVQLAAKQLPEVQKLWKNGGLAAKATLDSRWQKSVERIMAKTIDEYQSFGVKQGAAIVMQASTGKVRVMVGGDGTGEFNLATMARRSPASTLKVIPYAAVLEAGILPQTKFTCRLATGTGDRLGCSQLRPGSYSMADGLAYSDNAIAWQVARAAGLALVGKMARRLGVTGGATADYGLVVGQGNTQVSLMRLAQIYGAIANGGILQEPRYLSRIFDTSSCRDVTLFQNCQTIHNFNQHYPEGVRVFSRSTTDAMDGFLQGVIRKPGATGSIVDVGKTIPDLAGKTGTNGVSNDARDLWFVGYSRRQDLVVAIWLGSGEGKAAIRSADLRQRVGGHLAAKVFDQVMRIAIVQVN